jgi:predicted negative regulator of RcsB-dependent stress response
MATTTRRKLTREELERDEVAESIQELKDSFKENKKVIVGVAIGGVALIVAIFGYRAYSARVLTQTSQRLNAASILFAELPGMQNEEERNRRLDSTIAAMQELIDQSPDTPAAREAQFLKGNCYFYKDDLTQAEETFRQYIAGAKTDEEKAKGELALGYTLENQFYFNDTMRNKLDEALAHFELAANVAPPKSHHYYEAQMSRARILELTFRDAQALEIYRQVMADRPPPRAGAPEDETESAPTGNALLDFVNTQIKDRMEPLSYYATAKVRADRLEATSTVLNPTATVPEPAAPAVAPAPQPPAQP